MSLVSFSLSLFAPLSWQMSIERRWRVFIKQNECRKNEGQLYCCQRATRDCRVRQFIIENFSFLRLTSCQWRQWRSWTVCLQFECRESCGWLGSELGTDEFRLSTIFLINSVFSSIKHIIESVWDSSDYFSFLPEQLYCSSNGYCERRSMAFPSSALDLYLAGKRAHQTFMTRARWHEIKSTIHERRRETLQPMA